MNVEFQPRQIPAIASTVIRQDGAGRPDFSTQRTAVGELLYRLKYRGDRSAIVLLAEAAVAFLRTRGPFDTLLPVPPSNPHRSVQPVIRGSKSDLPEDQRPDLFDDLYRSGGTASAIAQLLLGPGGAANV